MHNSGERILVQKFGGSSLATDESRKKAVNKIKQAQTRGYKPVVVVSAIGRKGDPYATDTLISLVKQYEVHIENKKLDLLMSCGEIISAVLIAGMLEKEGLSTCVFTGGRAGIITDDNFGNARIIKIQPYNIKKSIEKGEIPVIAGFQGVTEKGEVTTLGRGGSDTTAAALGAGLRAEAVEIYTDVDGIMTADPRIVPDARILNRVSYYEIFEMANNGARVIHPRAVEIAMKGNIPIIIKNTFNENSGTLIINEQSEISFQEDTSPKPVTAVTHIPDIVQISIDFRGLDNLQQVDFLYKLADRGISIDLINFLPDRKIFTVSKEHAPIACKVLRDEGCKIKVISECTKVSVVGIGMTGVPGVMAKMVDALTAAGVNILQTSDSNITISCLVKKEDEKRAVNALHKKFNLGGDRCEKRPG